MDQGQGEHGAGQGHQQGQGHGRQGMLENPRLLAAAAAGCGAAAVALYAFYGLPGGATLFWLVPLPLFLAGLGFGPGAATLAAGLAALLLGLLGGTAQVLTVLALFIVPATLLQLAGLRAEGVTLRLPLALLGLWPAAVLLLVAALLPDGMDVVTILREAMGASLKRMGFPASSEMVERLVRIGPAAIGLWVTLTLLANAAAAERLLRRLGLARIAWPGWGAVRLPEWYPVLPALLAGLAVATSGDSNALPLALLLLLLLPLFYQGVAGVHARAQGQRGRVPALALFYLLLVPFLHVLGPGLVGLGLHDQLLRRPAAPPQA